jgi:hypothetical protein
LVALAGSCCHAGVGRQLRWRLGWWGRGGWVVCACAGSCRNPLNQTCFAFSWNNRSGCWMKWSWTGHTPSHDISGRVTACPSGCFRCLHTFVVGWSNWSKLMRVFVVQISQSLFECSFLESDRLLPSFLLQCLHARQSVHVWLRVSVC